jgi:hypothetical protein
LVLRPPLCSFSACTRPPPRHLDLTTLACLQGSRGRRRPSRRRPIAGGRTCALPAPACTICSHHRLPRPRLGRLRPAPNSGELGKQPPHQTLTRGELLACMRQATRTTHPGRRSPPNRTAEAAYRFALHPGLAGEPPGPDLAQIWRSPARSGLFVFFSVCLMISELVLWFKSV